MVNHRCASMKKGMASSRLAAAVCCYAVILTTLVGATIPQGETLLEVAKEWHGLDANSPTYVQYFSSWVAGTDPCVSLWVGTNCSSAGDVEGLNLTQAGLHGPVPAAMSRLTSLKLLDLSNGPIERYYNSNNNFITGDLAPLGSLTNLMYLNMGRNVLGLKVFPEAVKNLTNIRTLLIDNTRIEGPFPDLSNLTKLEKLFLGNNSMTGPFPRSLTQITSLRELTLWYNSLIDVLPAELSNLGNLTYFNCNRCKLFGGLPPELGKLTKMKRFHLYKNEMSGRIPREYSAWKSLTELRLELNYFHGSFSPEFFKLANLTKLILNNMQLYGSLPGDLTNNTVPNLKELAMSCNYFTGATPKLTNGAVISGDDQTIPSLAYNCFDGLTQDELGQGTRCNRKLSCQPFQEALQNNGCPDCPPAQRISNTTTCVCMPGGDGKREPWVAPVIGLSAALAVLIIILLVIVFLTSCFRHKPFDKTRDIFGKRLVEEHYDPNWKVPAGLKAFTLAELSHMTKDFSESQVVGQGGFGKVYRGVAPDGKEVAIKRSSASASSHENTQGMQEFRNEIDLLSRLHHRNLVKLEGFCDEEGMQILVYEYMRHGNLHMIMFRDDLIHYMDWYKRLEIAVETAQGLEYLHHHADPSVIHRDVKPGNILLNEYLQAKVADFGISRESAEYDTHVSTKLAGTAGYFDPQYFLHRRLTKASDVYSYGVCLLELVTGQKAIDHERGQESNLVEWAKPRLNKLGVDSIVDPRLHGDYPPSVFLDMANLAIMCSLFDKNERPTMREVVAVLEPQLKAATRPSQWALPLRAIPELTWRRTGASSSSTENFSHVLRKIQAEDQVPLTEASTNSSFTTVHVDPR